MTASSNASWNADNIMRCAFDSALADSIRLEAVQEAHEGCSKEGELQADIRPGTSQRREESSGKKSKGQKKERSEIWERRGFVGE